MDDKYVAQIWIWMTAILVAAALSISLGCYAISVNRQIKMAELGYEQVQCIGRGDYVWQKAK